VTEFQVGVHDDLIVVIDPATRFYAIYSKPPDQRRLILERRRPTKDHKTVARARKAANTKARELGWIVQKGRRPKPT
jgi:hypothetical protein